jgi:hypothetical protein
MQKIGGVVEELKLSGFLVTKVEKIRNGFRVFINGISHIDFLNDDRTNIYYLRKIDCNKIDEIRLRYKKLNCDNGEYKLGFYITDSCYIVALKSGRFSLEELKKYYIYLVKITDSLIR